MPAPLRRAGPAGGSYQVVGCDGHGEDFDAQVLGLVDSVFQAPARLLVALQGVPVRHHYQVLVLLQVGAPARGVGGGEALRPSPDPNSSGTPATQLSPPKMGGEEPQRETRPSATLGG